MGETITLDQVLTLAEKLSARESALKRIYRAANCTSHSRPTTETATFAVRAVARVFDHGRGYRTSAPRNVGQFSQE